MISLDTQIKMLTEISIDIVETKQKLFEIALYPEVMLKMDLRGYPKKPKISLPKRITKSIPDIELFIPSLRNWNKLEPPHISEIIQVIMQTLESITGKIVHISKLLFEELMKISRGNHPRETFCVLRLKNGHLCEYILAPQSVSSEKSAIFFPHRIGRDRSIIASFHTHPSGVFTPSRGDLKSFRLNPVNIIMGNPYNSNSLGVYDSLGHPLNFKIE